MSDDETGSWWQQITGKAIHGPQKDAQLESIFHDELTFGIWKAENPNGRVLRPDEKIVALGEKGYPPENWEDEVGAMRVTTSAELDRSMEPRTIVLGIKVNGLSKAYPLQALEKQNPIIDGIGDKNFILILGEDKKSFRMFETAVDGKELEFFMKTDGLPLRMTDKETGSVWDFSGKCIEGELTGKQLKQAQILKDYWFNWKTYNPETKVYTLGNR